MSKAICFKSISKFIFLLGFLFVGITESFAQNPSVLQTVSPYSRFGIGDFQMNGGLLNAGMGGGGIGMRNDSLIPQYINFQNPASFSAHPLIAYEISMMSNTVKLKSGSTVETFNRTTLGNFALAFPVTKWWGAGFGLVPYSAVGYNVSNTAVIDGIGPVTYKYEGSGGVNQVFLCNAFRPFANVPRHFLLSQKYENFKLAGDSSGIRKSIRRRTNLANISIGIESSYLFGSLNNTRRDVFPDSAYTFNTKISKRTLFHDAYFNYGIQYTFQLKKSLNPLYTDTPDSMVTKTKLFHNRFYYKGKDGIDTAALFVRSPGIRVSYGLVFSLPTSINVSYDLLAQNYKQIGTIEQFRDTIVSRNGVDSTVTIPAMGGFGFSLKKDYKWMFQMDYMTQLWSQASFGSQNLGLKNSQRITAGFQYQPHQGGKSGFLGYMGVVQYRLGARYYKTSLDLNKMQLTEMSVNFSMSLPVPYRTKLGEPVSRGTINFEYGIRGTTQNNLIQENFFRVTFGVTINDRWFSHVKYD
jgi:hypothetical protein